MTKVTAFSFSSIYYTLFDRVEDLQISVTFVTINTNTHVAWGMRTARATGLVWEKVVTFVTATTNNNTWLGCVAWAQSPSPEWGSSIALGTAAHPARNLTYAKY